MHQRDAVFRLSIFSYKEHTQVRFQRDGKTLVQFLHGECNTVFITFSLNFKDVRCNSKLLFYWKQIIIDYNSATFHPLFCSLLLLLYCQLFHALNLTFNHFGSIFIIHVFSCIEFNKFSLVLVLWGCSWHSVLVSFYPEKSHWWKDHTLRQCFSVMNSLYQTRNKFIMVKQKIET